MLALILCVFASCSELPPAAAALPGDGVIDRRPVVPAFDPYKRAQPWIDDALQIDSVEKRKAAIESIRSAIAGTDEHEAYAGLIALTRIREVEFDKAAFRDPVLHWLDAKDERVRYAALYALLTAGKQPGDLDRAIAVGRDMQGNLRSMMVSVLASFSDMNLTGAAGDEVLRIIATDDHGVLRQALSGLANTKVSPAIEARLLELSNDKDGENAHDAIYFGLSTLQDKSEAVVDRLIAALSEDRENAWRALWGLGQGIPRALEPKVAAAAMKLYAARSDRQTRTNAMSLIERFGGEAEAEALDAIALKPGVGDEERKQVTETARKIRAKKPAPR